MPWLTADKPRSLAHAMHVKMLNNYRFDSTGEVPLVTLVVRLIPANASAEEGIVFCVAISE
jgi:hypothetical protein